MGTTPKQETMVFSATKATTTQLDSSQVKAMSDQQIVSNCNAAGSPADFGAKYDVGIPSFVVTPSGLSRVSHYSQASCRLLPYAKRCFRFVWVVSSYCFK